ncbi:hypothetical protein C8R43DRAFT_1008652 [Mycena crocata]|nr:hypothetical protein C8R43DRAFT_1008652 [Mycena crocata]
MPTTLSLRRLVDRFYSKPQSDILKPGGGYTIPLLGLNGCGKTTLLDCLGTGNLVESSPTPFGLRLETASVRLPELTDELMKMPSWNMAECGGKRLPPAFLAHYTQTVGSDALIWLVDSSDHAGLDENLEEFGNAIDLLSYPGMKSTDMPVLILATKQDAPNSMPIAEIQTRFAHVTAGLQVLIVGTTLSQLQHPTAGPLLDAFRWLLYSVNSTRTGNPPPLSPTDDPRSPMALELALDSWLERAESDSSAARFLQQFQTMKLPAWDHYTHVRIIYSVLTGFGRHKGRDMILHGMETYAAMNEQARARPFHFTLTCFWIQVVHFGISGMPPLPQSQYTQSQLGLGSDHAGSLSYLESMLDSDDPEMMFDAESIVSGVPSDWSVVDDEDDSVHDEDNSLHNEEDSVEEEELPQSEDSEPALAYPDPEEDGGDPEETASDPGFVRFLLLNPFVVDEHLWTGYYSRNVLMSAKAKVRMVLPDKRRLPNLVGRDAISSMIK